MPNFSFSAFLKLVCSNPRPQASQIRQRLTPSTRGYDYHRSLKLRIQRYLISSNDFENILASTNEIIKASERNSAIVGLKKLREWRDQNPDVISAGQPISYQSPSKEFSITYTPNFVISYKISTSAFHIWNNVTPALTRTPVYGALSLLGAVKAHQNQGVIEFGVFSLRDLTEYKLGDVPDHREIGHQMARGLDKLFRKIRSDLGVSEEVTRRIPEERPRPSF